MSAINNTSSPIEPHVPDRVAIETPRGDIRTGDVVGSTCKADGTRWYTVEIEGSTFRRSADEVGLPNEGYDGS